MFYCSPGQHGLGIESVLDEGDPGSDVHTWSLGVLGPVPDSAYRTSQGCLRRDVNFIYQAV